MFSDAGTRFITSRDGRSRQDAIDVVMTQRQRSNPGTLPWGFEVSPARKLAAVSARRATSIGAAFTRVIEAWAPVEVAQAPKGRIRRHNIDPDALREGPEGG